MSPAHVLTAFAVTFPAELPDKTFIASLLLGSRMRPLAVWTGVAAAFAVHVTIAVAVGRTLDLLPHRVVEGVVAALFLAGAAYMLLVSEEEEEEAGERAADAALIPARSFRSAAIKSFIVIFIAEWGDITQVVTANLAAKYHDAIGVGIGSLAALVVVGWIGVSAGANLVRFVPLTLVRRIGGVVLLALGALSVAATVS
ncbi:MAG TPA: TMEM165/GDT1 family protein [Acidimicrobiales bacterium]|nr:TMEM165/GDT1 family protein [Acidimicrobiales bacterium]